jgi:hypothetical protein
MRSDGRDIVIAMQAGYFLYQVFLYADIEAVAWRCHIKSIT